MPSPTPAPAVTTQVQKQELPAWVDAASQKNYADMSALAEKPYQPFTGDRVAGLTAGEQAAPGILGQGMATTNGALGTALGAAQGATGFKPGQVTAPTGPGNVTAGSFLSGDIQKYMQPNIDNVVNTTMTGMRQNLDRSAQGLSDSARSQGAWNGSRAGVESAVLKAQGAQNMAQTEAGLRGAAFTDAAGRMQADNATALQAALANQQTGLATNAQGLQAQTANQSAGIAGAGLNLQGGQLATTIGQTASDTAGRNALLSSQFGANERGINQAGLDANYQSFLERRNYPMEMENAKLAALGMSPYGKTTSGTTSQTTPSTSNPLMQGIGAAAAILPLMFSDRKTKTNIKKVGKMPNDLNVYEFDYKKSFGGAKDQVGFMADDVKKKVGAHAVTPVKVGGKTVDAVNYDVAAKSPRKPRNDKGQMRGTYRPRGTVPFLLGNRAA